MDRRYPATTTSEETLASVAKRLPTEANVRITEVSDAIRDEIATARPRRTTPVARVVVTQRASRSDSLRAMLASPTALQQAVLLTEILGPPKSLRRPD